MPVNVAPPILATRVLICRTAHFAAGRRLCNPNWDDARNTAAFGKDTLPHGNNYVVDVFYGGPVESNGMIANLAEIKAVIATAVQPLDCSFLDEVLPHFASRRPTVENVVDFIWHQLPVNIGSARIHHVMLGEGSRVSAFKSNFDMFVTRKYEFAAAHRLHMTDATVEQNESLYGKCNNLHGHGHNYGLDVTVAGEPDDDTGAIIAAAELDTIVEEIVFAAYDHKHLNDDCAEFKTLIPTSENLAKAIFARLQPAIDNPQRKLKRIGLHETQKNYFEVEAAS